MATHLDFYQWVREDFGWREDFDDVVAFDDNRVEEGMSIVHFQTTKDSYSIFAHDPDAANPEGYLMCLGRIDDLAVGPLTREAWTKILADIVANELKTTMRLRVGGSK